MPIELAAVSADPGFLSEKDIQAAFEKQLDRVEPGLKVIAPFVGTGVGIIDSLAIDENGSPVVLEFKRAGRPAIEALIQALDYAVWCRDNFSWVEKTIVSSGYSKPVARSIRLIVVASEFDDRVKRAARGVEFDVQLVSFGIYQRSDTTLIVPKIETDTSSSRGSGEPLPPKNKIQHFAHLPDKIHLLYDRFEQHMKKLSGINVNYQPQHYIGFQFNGKNIVAAHPKREWIRLDFRLTADEALADTYVGMSGEWGYFHLSESTFDEAARLVDVAIKKFSQQLEQPSVLPSA